MEQELRQALDKQAIHDLAMRYPRGLDRGDAVLLQSIFHEGATVDYGLFTGTAAEFVPWVIDFLAETKCTFHSIANELIQVDGDVAHCEFYGTAYMCADTDGELTDSFIGGRYLDRWERRNGEWKITHRHYVMDWNQNRPASAVWDEGLYAQLKTRGCRGPDDPLYRLGFARMADAS